MMERALLVGAVAAVVIALILLLRRRPIVRARPVRDSGLPPGVYLLTSADCDTCVRARDTLTRRAVSYTELSWEKNPEIFERVGIDAVPSVLRIGSVGDGTWWRGGVPPTLRRR